MPSAYSASPARLLLILPAQRQQQRPEEHGDPEHILSPEDGSRHASVRFETLLRQSGREDRIPGKDGKQQPEAVEELQPGQHDGTQCYTMLLRLTSHALSHLSP